MRGFTLIELIVVIAIMGLVSGVVFGGVQTGEKSLLLDRTAHLLAQDIRRTMDLTLKAEAFDSCPGSGAISAYAIHFQNETYETGSFGMVDGITSYVLYAVCDGSFKYDKNDDADLEFVQLEKGIEIKTLLKNPGVPNSKLDIAFEPPDPVVHFEEGDPPFIIILAPKDASIIGYEYRQTGDVLGWQSPEAGCAGPSPNIECPFSFPA
jgi:prepilin-type N-terminal cleavage/methylation domain-containing protein